MNPGLAGLGAAFSWGAADFMARFNGRAIGSDRTLLVVLGLSTLMLTPFAITADFTALRDPATAAIVAGAAVATMAALWLLYETLSRGPLSVVVPILACYPAPLVVWAVLFKSLELSVLLVTAMALTLTGVWIVARVGHRTQHKEGHALGRLSVTLGFAVATVIAFDVYVVLMDQAVAAIGNIPAIWATRGGAFAIMAVLALARRRGVSLSPKVWALLAAQGFIDTFGFVLLFTAQGEGGIALATVASSAYGVVTVVLARVFLKEIVPPASWFGLALVFVGVVTLTANP